MSVSSALQRPHVLIVSDDLELSTFLSEGLIYEGLWTSVIASALQTLEVFRLRSFDAVIVDAALHGLGAAELISRLRQGSGDRGASDARGNVPIFAVAERNDELDASGIDWSLVTRVLIAPLELEEVARIVSQDIELWRQTHPDRPWADAFLLGTRDDRSAS